MNLPLFFARRYFFSPKKKNFINVLSVLSMLGVAVGTAALIIVLSAFNGMQVLIRSMYAGMDAHLLVTPAKGKTFNYTPALQQKLKGIPGIAVTTEVLEDNALLLYNDLQTVIKLKGINENFLKTGRIDNYMSAGEAELSRGPINYAIVGAGLQHSLKIPLNSDFTNLQIWYPKPGLKAVNNPENAFYKEIIIPHGSVSIEHEFDNTYVLVPLGFARKLFNKETEVTGLELMAKPGVAIETLKAVTRQTLGASFEVKDSDEQHASILRVLYIEKAFVFLALAIILVIASFNIFVSLSMLVIEKQRDISILFSMGADGGFIRNLFLTEGSLIAIIGAISGMVTGYAVCLLQQQYPLVSMNTSSSIFVPYPISMHWADFALISLLLIVITLAASLGPAIKAGKQSIKIGNAA